MDRGGRKTQWLPKDNSSATRLPVEKLSSSYKPENSGTSSSVGSVSKWSNVVTPPNVSDKPSTDSLRSPSLVEQAGNEDKKITGSLDLGDEKKQASQESAGVKGKEVFFDICKTGNAFQLKTPLHLKNRERRNENNRNTQAPTIEVLRPGMFHLRHYISVADQVRIVQKCRNLALSPAGFYEPANQGGIGTYSRKMMILGKYWDIQNNKYADQSPVDGTKPHPIPAEFSKFAYQAIRDSHDHLRKQSVSNVEKTLPQLTPDICVVNFYSNSGRLGLHRDQNESEESLKRGLPVVSISIGDSAEFVYGDQGDIVKAEKVVLESGDMLIFGGNSRLVHHGVANIFPGTAPKLLLEETNLRPGRLNLTFRQY